MKLGNHWLSLLRLSILFMAALSQYIFMSSSVLVTCGKSVIFAFAFSRILWFLPAITLTTTIKLTYCRKQRLTPIIRLMVFMCLSYLNVRSFPHSLVCSKINTMGTTYGAETAYRSESMILPLFWLGSCYLIFVFFM